MTDEETSADGPEDAETLRLTRNENVALLLGVASTWIAVVRFRGEHLDAFLWSVGTGALLAAVFGYKAQRLWRADAAWSPRVIGHTLGVILAVAWIALSLAALLRVIQARGGS